MIKPFILAVCCLFSAISAICQNVDLSFGIDKISANEKMRFSQKNFKANTTSDGVDVHFVEAFWSVNPAAHYISGKITHHLKVNTNRTLLDFDIHSNHTVSQVKINGQVTSNSRFGDQLILQYNFAAGTDYAVEITYAGTPPPDPDAFGSFVTATHEGVPILWTLSEPFGALDWWPCRQNLSDKIDSIDIRVEIPQGDNKVASVGLLQSVEQVGNKQVYFWKHRYPIATYLVAIAVTNYVEFNTTLTLPSGDLFVQHMVYPEELPAQLPAMEKVYRHLAIFDSLFGAYPFMNEKYGHARFGRGGGMEHQTMSFMGGWDYDLISHELGHQWFGDRITCANWADIWLNEGFATYLSGLCHNVESPDLYWQIWKKNVIKSVISKADGSVYITDPTEVSRIFDTRLTYYKGAMVLHMLRWTLGDEVFFKSIRDYLNQAGLVNNFALTEDFQKSVEKTAGKDLDYFFQQWIYKEGFPSYRVRWNNLDKVVNVQVHQSSSHTSVPFFTMDIPLQFKSASRDTIVRVPHDFNGQTYSFELDFTPDSLLLDPDKWLVMGAPTIVRETVPFTEKSAVLYPNPSADIANIWIASEMSNLAEVSLYDNLGRQLAAPILLLQKQLLKLDISQLANGSYTVVIRDGDTNHQLRLLKTDR